MIENIESFESLEKYYADTLYAVRIKAVAQTYGFSFPFARFYRQTVGQKCTALFCILDGEVTLDADYDAADLGELAAFFQFSGFSSLLCEEAFSLEKGFKCGAVMSADASAIQSLKASFEFVDKYDELLKLFEFLGYGGSFGEWYADIKRRLNKGTALAGAVYDGEKIISAALFSSIYKNCAVLSGVKTDENYRNKGYAGALVRALASEISGKIYLMRELNRNERFYQTLGFTNVGKWRIYE